MWFHEMGTSCIVSVQDFASLDFLPAGSAVALHPDPWSLNQVTSLPSPLSAAPWVSALAPCWSLDFLVHPHQVLIRPSGPEPQFCFPSGLIGFRPGLPSLGSCSSLHDATCRYDVSGALNTCIGSSGAWARNVCLHTASSNTPHYTSWWYALGCLLASRLCCAISGIPLPFALICLLGLSRVMLHPLHLAKTPLGRLVHAALMPGRYAVVLALGQIGSTTPPALRWSPDRPSTRRLSKNRHNAGIASRCIMLLGALLLQAIGATAAPPYDSTFIALVSAKWTVSSNACEAHGVDHRLPEAPTLSERIRLRMPISHRGEPLLPEDRPEGHRPVVPVPPDGVMLLQEQAADEAMQSPAVLRAIFAVLTIDTAPEFVNIALREPSKVEEALRAVSEARDHEKDLLFSQLHEIKPQPFSHFATVLALPHWCADEPIICFDLT